MATKKKPATKRGRARGKGKATLKQHIRRWLFRGALVAVVLMLLAVLFYAMFDPRSTAYMRAEAARLGSIDREWVDLNEVAPVAARAVVAAEDANFCRHWGFDMDAIRGVIAEGSNRGASTISQQTVKNTFLWHGRSWTRKALEALMTPLVEAIWSKRRILEVYLNVAEFDEGVFGIDAAAHHYFRVAPGELTATQAARLAAVLPAPKLRSAAQPNDFVRRRTRAIIDGAATIAADGRAACFQ